LSLYAYLPLDKVVGSLALSGIYPFVHSQLGMVGVTISEYPSLEYWDPYFTASNNAILCDRALRAAMTARLPLGTLAHLPIDITDKEGAVIYSFDYRAELSLGATAFYSLYSAGEDLSQTGSMAGGGLTLYIDWAQHASLLFRSSTAVFVAYDFKTRQINYGLYTGFPLPNAVIPPYWTRNDILLFPDNAEHFFAWRSRRRVGGYQQAIWPRPVS
jgi:hypothetical protein